MKRQPRSRELGTLAPRDLAAAVDRLVLTRWAAAALVLALTLACTRILGVPLPEVALLGLGGCLLGYNAVLAALAAHLRRRSDEPRRTLLSLRRLVLVQVALDWVAMTAFLHLTGGVTSPAIPLFLIHMLMVTVLLPAPSPYVYVALATAALSALATLERAGLLAHHGVLALPEGLHRDPRYLLAQISFFAIVSFVSVHLTGLVVSQLRERDRQVAALLDAAHAVAGSLKLEEVLDQLVQSAARALSAKAAAIRLLDETGQRMTMIASCGLSQRYLGKGFVEMSRSQMDREALAGARVVVADATRDPRIQYPREVTDEGITSILVVPVIGRRGPLGVLRVYDERPGRFDGDDVEFALSVAAQGAAAIENAMAHGELQRLEATRAQFVRTVTHELRSPLSGARSLLRVLLDGLAGEVLGEQRGLLARVDTRLASLSELVNDLLALAASRSAEMREAPAPVDLTSALRRIVEHHGVEAGAKGVQMALESPSEPLFVSATDQGLARIFGNLVGNGVKYTPAGGSVRVRVERQGAQASVSVADTGMGIPADELPRLWTEFFRARNARQSEIAGTGLGLSIVKQLVASFGGLVSVKSEEGKGTTFTVTLPLAESASVPAAPQDASA